jgi:hypothetical protein
MREESNRKSFIFLFFFSFISIFVQFYYTRNFSPVLPHVWLYLKYYLVVLCLYHHDHVVPSYVSCFFFFFFGESYVNC